MTSRALFAGACIALLLRADAFPQSRVNLGTQTHFSQGWSADVLARARLIGAGTLRDSIPWKVGEPTPGNYDFTGPAAAKLKQACASGFTLVLTEVPTHPAYDQYQTVNSPAGQAAYAHYLQALAREFGSCLIAIEVGNEINGARAMVLPAGVDPANNYVSLLKAVKAAVKPAAPGVAILGGSTNMIGTGFLTTLFAAGMLAEIDGVAVHQYRIRAEGADLEIAHLIAVMRQSGREVPVWVTEFSIDSSDEAAAAGEALKAYVLLSAGGSANLYWYALLDQASFPNMGLFNGGRLKQQGQAFTQITRELTATGKPSRLELGDPLLFAYAFGPDRAVVWGAPRQIAIDPAVKVFSASGASIDNPGKLTIGERPVLLKGATTLEPGHSAVLADTLLGYGGPGWRYFARSPSGKDYPLSLFDDRFDSYFGGRSYKPLRIGPFSAAVAGNATSPTRALWRHVVASPTTATIKGCLAKTVSGDGVDYEVFRNGISLIKGVATSTATVNTGPLALAAGDQIDFAVGPNQTSGGDAFNYRFMIVEGSSALSPECPPLR